MIGLWVSTNILELPSAVGAQGKVLVMGGAYVPGHATTVVAQVFAERLGEVTGKKVRVVFQHSGALGLEREMVQRVQVGTLDFTPAMVAVLASLVPEMWVFQMPYLFRDYPHLFSAIDATEAIRTYCEAAFDRKGFKLVALIVVGYRAISGPSPVNMPADLRGKKIRVGDDGLTVAVFATLGAAPVAIALPEVRSSFQTRAIDFAEGGLAGFSQSKVYETVKHVIDVRHLHQMAALVMSKAAWGKQDAATRKAIMDAARHAEQENRKAVLVEDHAVRRQILEKGATISRPDPGPFRQATKRVYDELYALPAGKDARRVVELIVTLK